MVFARRRWRQDDSPTQWRTRGDGLPLAQCGSLFLSVWQAVTQTYSAAYLLQSVHQCALGSTGHQAAPPSPYQESLASSTAQTYPVSKPSRSYACLLLSLLRMKTRFN